MTSVILSALIAPSLLLILMTLLIHFLLKRTGKNFSIVYSFMAAAVTYLSIGSMIALLANDASYLITWPYLFLVLALLFAGIGH